MGSIPLDFHAICRSTADGVVFGSPLMMPEVSGIGRDEERVVAQLQRLAARHLAEMEPLERHRRIVGGAPAVDVLRLVLDPPADQSAWRTTVEWDLPCVRWEHQGRQAALFVPALDVMLVVREDQAESELRTEVLATLKRRGASVSLAEIERLRRSSDAIVWTFRASVDVLDPKR